ncbi:hypothetical protein EI94DRAFT_1829971 [Lactarius quietus]|nr:hypothetical protein EI94DRAFT_1829971 [Lactarius quietus]
MTMSRYPVAATGWGGEIHRRSHLTRLAAQATGRGLWPPCAHASALDIILNGPLGAAEFSEFGRSTLAGYFRALAEPLALARYAFAQKSKISPGARAIVSRERFSFAVVVTAVREAPAMARSDAARVPTYSIRRDARYVPSCGPRLPVRFVEIAGLCQIPASDLTVRHASYSFDLRAGEAIALSKRTPLVLLSAPAAARWLLPIRNR